MKQIIMDVLDDMSESQINLASEAARETVSTLISAALKTKGIYTEYGDDEIEEQKARETWICSICGENTFEVDSDYIGTGTNHLGCEMKSWNEIKDYVDESDPSDPPVAFEDPVLIGGSEEVDGMYFDDEVKEWEEAVGYKEPDLKFDPITEELYTDEPHEELPFREKNWLQKKHEDKVFGNVQKQIYNEMTSDGLPAGGDTQAVLESHKLADEIVDNKGKWIYESPDGGKTVFRRPFADYDPKNKEEIDWETKEPTGRKFTEYNNENWNNKKGE